MDEILRLGVSVSISVFCVLQVSCASSSGTGENLNHCTPLDLCARTSSYMAVFTDYTNAASLSSQGMNSSMQANLNK